MGVGQFSGPKGKYVYTSDTGDLYLITRDTDLAGTALTEVSLPLYTNQTDVGYAPPRFKPRGVYWKADASPFYRKFLICGAADAAAYDNSAPVAITIDGIAGKTTGKRGERVTY